VPGRAGLASLPGRLEEWLGTALHGRGLRTLPPLYPQRALFEPALAGVRARPPLPGLTGLIVPHHLLARQLIADGFALAAAAGAWERVVILGPDHFNLGQTPVTAVDAHFDTPFGVLACDLRRVRRLAAVPGVSCSDLFFREHGFGSLLPFVKHYLPDARVCAVAIRACAGRALLDRVAERLLEVLDTRTLVVQSTDFSHGLPLAGAEAMDAEAARVVRLGAPAGALGLHQPGHIDSAAALYLQGRLQREFFHGRPVPLDHGNAQDHVDEPLADSTSYFLVGYQAPRPEAGDRGRPSGASMVLAGDLMFDRGVAELMDRRGPDHPLSELAPVFRRADAAVANLECPLVAEPSRRAPLTFHSPPGTAAMLARAGLTHLHLANNHALDQGPEGFRETCGHLRAAGLTPMGHPSWEAEAGPEPVQVGAQRVLLVPLNATEPYFQLSRHAAAVAALRELDPGAVVVATLHWGSEYHTRAGSGQAHIGRALIEAGADLVVGHHPHVVQDIERHRGRLIFHSLGNLVFDQWRRPETRDGLLVEVSFPGGRIHCDLLPVEGRRAHPRLAGEPDRTRALGALAARCEPEVADGVLGGWLDGGPCGPEGAEP
jgi:poly-gamma-glutamate synthesis protein (capsule biosynthesis protein)